MNFFLVIIFLVFSILPMSVQADCRVQPNANIVLLKLDDLDGDFNGVAGVSSRWEKVTFFLEKNNIPASYGVIGDSLEADNPQYFQWLKQRVKVGNIELWNHGYFGTFLKKTWIGVQGEFDGRAAEQQAESILRTQTLGEKRIGIKFQGFGPHNSGVDKLTYQQLDAFPELRYVWFYEAKDRLDRETYLIKRVVNLEFPIFRPHFNSFLEAYKRRPKELGYIALQGHPNMWNYYDYKQFVQIVRFLQAEKATFCRPMDLLKAQ